MMTEPTTSLLVALPMPVLLIGKDDRIAAQNDAISAILGPDLLGRHHISVLRQPGLVAAVAQVRRNGGPKVARYIARGDPQDTHYRVNVADAAGQVLLCFEDQTAAEQASRMRRDFVANVSHELRTPLTALLGFIETLRNAARDDPAARDRFLEIMTHEANRMTRLVDDLMSLSRVEEDERLRPRENVDLPALLSSVIKGLEPQAKNAGVQVELDLHGNDEMVPGDPGQLVQVFTNLVENAIKYGASGERVTVRLQPRANNSRLRGLAVPIAVTDYGEGIAPHHIARLTERFYRVDTHRSRAVGGTGLGLAIVKHIVGRHRGHLTFQSELGQGTTAMVYLPVA